MTAACSIDGCGNQGELRRTWCGKHYRRWQRYGDTGIVHYDVTLTPEERFRAKVDKSPHPKGCWEWSATRNQQGYGRVKFDGWLQSAHRVSWKLAGNVLIEGLVIDHLCHNPACVRVSHLQQVTQSENAQHKAQESYSTTGVRGVYPVTGGAGYWINCSDQKGKSIYGGVFPTLDKAKEAVIELRLKHQTNNLKDR